MNRKIFLCAICSILAFAFPFSAIADENEVEIQLLEMISGGIGGDEPLDSNHEIGTNPPSPNEFHAYISDHNLTVTSDATPATQLIIRNRQTNQIVVNRQFLTIDTELLSAGSYSIELQCEDLTLVGQFDAE